MKTDKALEVLKKMPEKDFQTFFEMLPLRVQMLVKARMVNWEEVLPQWYINFKEHNENKIFTTENISF